MKSSSREEDKNIEENIIKYVRNLFRLKKKIKKETNDATIQGITNLFRLKRIKQLKTEYLVTLEIFWSIKKKIINN